MNMKKLTVAIAFVLMAFNVVGQPTPPMKPTIPDTLLHEAVRVDIAKPNIIQFHEYVTTYSEIVELNVMVAEFSAIATTIHGYNVEFTLDEIQRMKVGEFVPFPEVQRAIKKLIVLQLARLGQ